MAELDFLVLEKFSSFSFGVVSIAVETSYVRINRFFC